MASLQGQGRGGAPVVEKPASTLSAWLAVLSVAIGAFALVTTEFLPVGLLPAIAADLGISKSWASRLHAQAMLTLSRSVRGLRDA